MKKTLLNHKYLVILVIVWAVALVFRSLRLNLGIISLFYAKSPIDIYPLLLCVTMFLSLKYVIKMDAARYLKLDNLKIPLFLFFSFMTCVFFFMTLASISSMYLGEIVISDTDNRTVLIHQKINGSRITTIIAEGNGLFFFKVKEKRYDIKYESVDVTITEDNIEYEYDIVTPRH